MIQKILPNKHFSNRKRKPTERIKKENFTLIIIYMHASISGEVKSVAAKNFTLRSHILPKKIKNKTVR